MNIAVVGLGKIGLPLAVQFASRGHHVIGVDVDRHTVDLVNQGAEPFPGEQDLQSRLTDVVSKGLLKATSEYAAAVPAADVVVVVVPLVVDANASPDFAILDSATSSIAESLSPGTLVIYETTMPVGVTRGRWLPMLEKSGLRHGSDFHLAYSPERVLTGRVFADLRRYPKLIGCFSDEGSQRAREFYDTVLEFDERPDLERPNGVWDLGTPEAAELTKLAETTYRDVNIALANQFALFAQSAGINVHAVIEAANSQPYSHLHRPGISVGGHCIPVYPHLYLAGDPSAELVRVAREVNASMPGAAVARAKEELNGLQGLHVLVLGAAYRGGVKETAFSGVFPLVEALRAEGVSSVSVHDPLYSDEELKALGLEPFNPDASVDLVILHTDHDQYKDLQFLDLTGVRLLLDGRNLIGSAGLPVVNLGVS